MTTAISWLVGTVLMFVGFGWLGCSALGSRRRSRFYQRVGCSCVVIVAVAVGLAYAINVSALPQRAVGAVWVALLLAALAVAPVFFYETFARSQGPSEDDGDGGLGCGPPRPAPGPAGGGAPLPDADPARVRRRDHNRPSLRTISQRRPAAKPARPRAPVGPGRR